MANIVRRYQTIVDEENELEYLNLIGCYINM